MALTLHAMATSVGLAAVGAGAAVAYFRPGRLHPQPLTAMQAGLARLQLHRIDAISYLLAAGGVFTLIPETMQAFAPELMYGSKLAGTALEHLDYLAFVCVSLSFGLGLMRRLLLIQLEKASLPCP